MCWTITIQLEQTGACEDRKTTIQPPRACNLEAENGKKDEAIRAFTIALEASLNIHSKATESNAIRGSSTQ